MMTFLQILNMPGVRNTDNFLHATHLAPPLIWTSSSLTCFSVVDLGMQRCYFPLLIPCAIQSFAGNMIFIWQLHLRQSQIFGPALVIIWKHTLTLICWPLDHLSLHHPGSEQERAQDLCFSYDSSDCPSFFPQQAKMAQHTIILKQKRSSYPRDDVRVIAFSQFSSKKLHSKACKNKH